MYYRIGTRHVVYEVFVVTVPMSGTTFPVLSENLGSAL